MGVFDRFLNVIKLNENDGFDDDDFLDDEIDDYEETAPKKRFFKKPAEEDDLDDLDLDEKPSMRSTKSTFQKQPTSTARPRTSAPAKNTTSSKIAPMRARKSASGMEVCVIKPRSMDDAKEITETLLADCTVVLNMEGLNLDVAQRIIDFASGSCYAINGSLQKVSNFIFIITPSDVDVSGDFQEILSGAFDTSIGSKF